jgi:putative transcription factor
MEHQQWDPVVLRRKVVPLHVNPPEISREVKIDREEIGTHEKVTMSLAKTIQQARIARGYKTQKDLANTLGVKVDIINGYESGKSIPDNAVLQKLRRVLGVKLKN